MSGSGLRCGFFGLIWQTELFKWTIWEHSQCIWGKWAVNWITWKVYGQDDVIARALEEGATGYTVQPFSSMELASRVRAALRLFEEPRGSEPAGPFLLGE